MARADHLRVKRWGYFHHAIDCGDGTVIHYAPGHGPNSRVQIQYSSYQDFALQDRVETVDYAHSDPPDVVMERACGRLEEAKYHLLSNNCEHFARWCKTGHHESEQVRRVTSAIGGTTGTGASTALAVGALTTLGTAAGLSGGASTMSGLAAAGGLVGGGAIAGLPVFALAPAAAATFATQKMLVDDPHLPDSERTARLAGRTASPVLAGGAMAAGIATVSAAGVSGLSAAGITSGLAAIGSTFGGGMLAGTVAVVGLPAIAALGGGYLVYRLFGGNKQRTPVPR